MLQPKSTFSIYLWKDNEKLNFENKLKKILRYLIDDSLEIYNKLPAFMEKGLNEDEINCILDQFNKKFLFG